MKPKKGQPTSTKKSAAKGISFSSPLFWVLTGMFVLFLPYFQITSAMDASLMPRTMVSSIFLILLAGLVLVKNPLQPQDLSVMKQPLFLGMLLFLVLGIVSALLSYRPVEGIPDTLRIGIWTGVTLMSAIVFSNTEKWDEKIPLLVAITALIAFFVGFEQYNTEVIQNTATKLEDGRPTIYKVEGRMSHKNEFSNALMLLLPFLSYGIYRLKTLGKILCGIALTTTLIMIILLKTRAVWMGILGSIYMMAVVGLVYYKKLGIKPIVRNVVGGALLLLTASLLTIFLMGNPGDDFSFRGRIYSMLDTQSSHNIHRLNMWKATILMAKQQFMGVGPGIWRLEYMTYIPDMFKEIEQTNWGRPHNDYLWVWAEKGYLAAITFLGIFAGLLWMAFQVVGRAADFDRKVLGLLLLGGVVSYMTIAFFSFPIERINHIVFLGLMGGGITSLYHQIRPKTGQPSLAKWLVVPFALFFGFGAYYAYKAVEQEQHIKRAVIAQKTGRYMDSIKEAELSKNPLRPVDMANRPAEDYIALAYERLEMPNEALEAINKGLEYHPTSVQMLNRKGRYHYLRGEYEASAEAGHRALAIIPRSKTMGYNLAAVHIKMGEQEKALELLKGIPNYKRHKDVVQGIRELEATLGLPSSLDQ